MSRFISETPFQEHVSPATMQADDDRPPSLENAREHTTVRSPSLLNSTPSFLMVLLRAFGAWST